MKEENHQMQDLYQVLTNRKMFDMVLEQGLTYYTKKARPVDSINYWKVTGTKLLIIL